MPPKSKVSQSPNYNQILDWIDEGKSSRWISRELDNQFNEKIGHVAISNFRKKNIYDEAIEIVDTQLKKESQEAAEQSKKKEVVNHKVQQVQQEQEGDLKVQGLSEATARQYRGVLNVAENFEDDYYKMKKAEPYDDKITKKDVVQVSLQAVKLLHDINKNDTSSDEAITGGFQELADAIQRSREIQD